MMNPKDINTRRDLTAYLYEQLSSGAWGSSMLINFDSIESWTDDPVSETEVADEIREWRRKAGGGSL